MTTDDHDGVMGMLVILMVATSDSDHLDYYGDCIGDDMICVVVIYGDDLCARNDGGDDLYIRNTDNDDHDMCAARVAADNDDDVRAWL